MLLKHPDIVVLADDIYEHIHWADEPFATIAAVCPQLQDRVVTTNGVSKAYAMTGWRIGYAAGPESLIDAMVTVQSQSTTNPCSISQAAAVAALDRVSDVLLGVGIEAEPFGPAAIRIAAVRVAWPKRPAPDRCIASRARSRRR